MLNTEVEFKFEVKIIIQRFTSTFEIQYLIFDIFVCTFDP
jgi:hypothetical protein